MIENIAIINSTYRHKSHATSTDGHGTYSDVGLTWRWKSITFTGNRNRRFVLSRTHHLLLLGVLCCPNADRAIDTSERLSKREYMDSSRKEIKVKNCESTIFRAIDNESLTRHLRTPRLFSRVHRQPRMFNDRSRTRSESRLTICNNHMQR